jgi:hypothetical protein
MTQDELVELFRSQDPGAVQQVLDVLDHAGITYHLIGGEGGFDFASIGSEEPEERIINIEVSDLEAARAVLEEDSLKVDLPKDHYLLQSSEEELIEIVTHSSEWSPFDVAHARNLLEKNGVNTAELAEQQAVRIAGLKLGKPASKGLVFFGWLFAVLGGVIGIVIGYSLSKTKDKSADGEFYRYDEDSRAWGEKILKVGVGVALVCLVIRLAL